MDVLIFFGMPFLVGPLTYAYLKLTEKKEVKLFRANGEVNERYNPFIQADDIWIPHRPSQTPQKVKK